MIEEAGSSWPRLLSAYLISVSALATWQSYEVWPRLPVLTQDVLQGAESLTDSRPPGPSVEPAQQSDSSQSQSSQAPEPADDATAKPLANAVTGVAGNTPDESSATAAQDGPAPVSRAPASDIPPTAAAPDANPEPPAIAQHSRDEWRTEVGRREKDIVTIVFLFGVLGACLHAMQSLATYVGNRSFVSSWTVWYILRPIVGGVLAVLAYVVFRGGFLSQMASLALNPYAFAALGGLSGMFSKRVIDKMAEVVDVVLPTRPGTGDEARSDKLRPSRPVIARISPAAVPMNAASTRRGIVIHGTGIGPDTQVLIDGSAIPATSITNDQVAVELPESAVQMVRTLAIQLMNGTEKSEAKSLAVTPEP